MKRKTKTKKANIYITSDNKEFIIKKEALYYQIGLNVKKAERLCKLLHDYFLTNNSFYVFKDLGEFKEKIKKIDNLDIFFKKENAKERFLEDKFIIYHYIIERLNNNSSLNFEYFKKDLEFKFFLNEYIYKTISFKYKEKYIDLKEIYLSDTKNINDLKRVYIYKDNKNREDKGNLVFFEYHIKSEKIRVNGAVPFDYLKAVKEILTSKEMIENLKFYKFKNIDDLNVDSINFYDNNKNKICKIFKDENDIVLYSFGYYELELSDFK